MYIKWKDTQSINKPEEHYIDSYGAHVITKNITKPGNFYLYQVAFLNDIDYNIYKLESDLIEAYKKKKGG
jgi:hypothetical protein